MLYSLDFSTLAALLQLQQRVSRAGCFTPFLEYLIINRFLHHRRFG